MNMHDDTLYWYDTVKVIDIPVRQNENMVGL